MLEDIASPVSMIESEQQTGEGVKKTSSSILSAAVILPAHKLTPSYMKTLTGDIVLSLSHADLLRLWHGLLGCSAPPKTSQELLRHVIMHEIQLLQHGKGVLSSIKKRLYSHLKETDLYHHQDINAHHHNKQYSSLLPQVMSAASLSIGTVLVREWHGELYKVYVEVDGYYYNNEYYKSLTAIAKKITRAHWSGPRFFGLKTAS